MNQAIDFGYASAMTDWKTSSLALLFVTQGTASDIGQTPGPLAVADASRYVELFEMQVGDSPVQMGCSAEVLCDPSPLEAAATRMTEAMSARKFPIFIGGDRNLTQTCCQSTLVAFWGKAGRMEIDETSFLGKQKTIIAGLRAASTNTFQTVPATTTILTADAVIHHPETLIEALKTEPKPVYLSIDLDVLSPGTVLASRSVEPGGLGWYNLMHAIEAVFNGPGVAAAEIIGTTGIAPRSPAALLGSQLILRLAGLHSLRNTQP